MILKIIDRWPSLLVQGIMMAIGYPVTTAYARQRVSIGMFTNAINLLAKHRPEKFNSLSVVNNFISFMYGVLKVEQVLDDEEGARLIDGNVSFVLRIPKTSGHVSFLIDTRNKELSLGVELEDEDEVPKVELAILINWMCLQPALRKHDITIEKHTLSIGMWTAAKLYECEGDLAGKSATIDQALDMR